MELRIHVANERKLFLAAPALDLFLSTYGIPDIAIGLEVDKPDNFILLCEATLQLLLVLRNAALKVVCNAGVKHSAWVGKNVDMVESHGGGFLHERVKAVTKRMFN